MLIIKKYPQELEIPYHLLLDADPSKKLVDEYLSKGILFGAFLEAELAGECILIFHNKINAEIINLAVSEKYRNRSIGKYLIEIAENHARLYGCKHIEIGTSEQLQKYYEKAGYTYYKSIKNFFVKNYDFPVIDNGIVLKDMIKLTKEL